MNSIWNNWPYGKDEIGKTEQIVTYAQEEKEI